jgi:hypothetical protein
MSRKPPESEEEAIGSDSFLDIASNIVGVLIILVLVTGTQVKSFIEQSVQASRKVAPAATAEAREQTRNKRDRAQRLVGEVNKLAGEATKLGREIAAAQYARERLGTDIATAELQIEAQRKLLDDDQRKRHDIAAQMVSAQLKLNEIQREQISTVSAPAPEIAVKSYPSPISKTVFTKEEHFRLLQGRVVRIPFEELKESLLGDRRQMIWKLNDLPEISGSAGPIDGFRLDYHVVRTATGGGALTVASYIPVQAALGEPLAEALAEGSAFRRAIDRLDRQNTTITVWTYQDSFNEFRLLKKELYMLGFSVAGRPMVKDARISFSPSGSKSSSQ